jgi:hypothetical protein
VVPALLSLGVKPQGRETGHLLHLVKLHLQSLHDLHGLVQGQLPLLYHPRNMTSYAQDKQKSFTIMKMKMYAILDKAKPHTENRKGFNLAAVILRPFKCLDSCGMFELK